MNIKEFGAFLYNEDACIDLVRRKKEEAGIVCPKCGSREHYYNSKHRAHDCKKCRYRTTLRSGTVMESSKLPFRYWITAIYFMTLTKKSFSALEMQRIVNHKRYEPIWAMMHKIRAVIGKKDDQDLLFGNVEIANSRVRAIRKKQLRNANVEIDEEGKSKSNEMVDIQLFVSITPPKEPTSKDLRKTAFKRVSAFVIPKGDGPIFVSDALTKKGRFPDRGLNSFRTVTAKASIMRQYHPEDYELKKLHWARVLAGNFRKVIYGIHHNVSERYLQNYLNEYSFKTSFNNTPMFDGLFNICLENQWFNKLRYENG